ncbi:MAG: MFS transporter [Promethearchaeota archaeon]
MTEVKPSDSISVFRSFFPIYLLAGFFSLAFSGIYILIVPLSDLFWPGEVYHALEMGILITSMFWVISIAGILFGHLIDKYNRTKILFIISLIRGVSMIALSFTIVGMGMESWWYFYLFVFIIGFSAGGNYPSVASLSDDLVPIQKKTKFFGLYKIIRTMFQLIGFLLTGVLVLLGLWRLFFSSIGIAIIISGLIMVLKIKEPKRGAQREELSAIIKDGAKYDFQLDKKTIRGTVLSKTNLVAIIEGIFSSVFMGSLTILFLPYVQTTPHNFSPFLTGVFLALFGLTGGLIIKLFLANFSDKISKDNHIRRLYLIVIALVGGSITFILLFYIPLPHLTIEEGKDIAVFFSFPIIWVMGSIYISSTSISALYDINQPPVLQEINLPEAQGQVVSLNRLLESIGFGSGPLITGILITISGQNYQLVALLIGVFSIPGVILWILSFKWYVEDKKKINNILKDRAKILKFRQQNLGISD